MRQKIHPSLLVKIVSTITGPSRYIDVLALALDFTGLIQHRNQPQPAWAGPGHFLKWVEPAKSLHLYPATEAIRFVCLLKTCLASPLIHLYQPVPSFWWPLIGSKVFLDLIGLFS